MNCPVCGGPMGFSEATSLGNCLRCDNEPIPASMICFAVGFFLFALFVVGLVVGAVT